MRQSRSAFLLSLTLIALSGAIVLAQSPAMPAPDAVEEDWQLVIANPDAPGVGPQITTVMSPVDDKSAPFVAFDMNYREYPRYTAGGLQLQVWSSGEVIDTSTQGSAVLNTPNETLTWTQRMSIGGGGVNYDINNGASTTWGMFGQGERLGVSYPSAVNDLSGYSADLSASRSGASWQSNNVKSLTLVQVRYYANNKLIATDTNPRVLIAPSAASN